MDKLFGKTKSTGDSGEHWMSVSDLMAGLMMVFLFISVALMRDAMVERDKIKEVAETYQKTQQAIYIALLEEFAI
ncbi:OmpA family protein, partial [Vibrio parahaemolyticus]|nr:OmpA family protein [Vibrio parahaemolyticus]